MLLIARPNQNCDNKTKTYVHKRQLSFGLSTVGNPHVIVVHGNVVRFFAADCRHRRRKSPSNKTNVSMAYHIYAIVAGMGCHKTFDALERQRNVPGTHDESNNKVSSPIASYKCCPVTIYYTYRLQEYYKSETATQRSRTWLGHARPTTRNTDASRTTPAFPVNRPRTQSRTRAAGCIRTVRTGTFGSDTHAHARNDLTDEQVSNERLFCERPSV